MKAIRIRTFTLLCFFFILLMPWFFFVTAHVMETKTFTIANSELQNESLQKDLHRIVQLIEMNTDKWTDSNWQNQLQAHLHNTKLDAVILTASNEEIYRSSSGQSSAFQSTEKFSVIEDGRLLGKVIIYFPKSNMFQMIAALAGLVLAFVIIGIVMRRHLLKPLEKMSLAARQIAAGDWDAQLPLSGIKEVAHVRDGFELMVKGLKQSNRKQIVLEEERRFVIAAVAHDLRTPLFALRGYLDGLQQGIAQTPEKIAKYLAVCKEKSTQLDRLVEELFTFTKLDYMEGKLSNNTVDLIAILQTSIDSLNPQARQKHISIMNQFAGDCILNGDAHLLERAISNLLDNAVRHTPSEGKIVVACFADGNKIRFKIQDTGPGFSAEEIKHAFEPLYRGEASRSRSTGGSGLGLTISQTIVRRHGGELGASNLSDGGALLEGWLPVKII
ncbi:sensor histidine kinase [Paenibacillus sp. IITD108]|uniref:sensor histidine kinase n=1 Tax=Paenibacillus sp. IITD108 TaxID=3116649 RepID=UPI002F4038F8